MINVRNIHIDYDKYGHCVACHDTLIVKSVIDNKEQERALPNLDHLDFKLNDNSQMRVCICRTCKAQLEESDYDTIMDCVYKGWEYEVKRLDWTEEKKKEYLDRYKQKQIVGLA